MRVYEAHLALHHLTATNATWYPERSDRSKTVVGNKCSTTIAFPEIAARCRTPNCSGAYVRPSSTSGTIALATKSGAAASHARHIVADLLAIKPIRKKTAILNEVK